MTDEAKKIVDALLCDGYCGNKCNECWYWSEGGCHGRSLKNDAADLIERLFAELERVSLECDAAINDLNLTRDCDTCKSKVEPYDIAYDMCDKCDINRMNTRRISYCWRGVCKENCGGAV